MPANMPTIAILGGTGKEGKGLALRWSAAGYKVVIGSRQLDRAVSAAEEVNQRLGITTVSGLENDDAAIAGDICVLTVTQSAHQQALESLKEVLIGKIFVDATSRVDYADPKPPSPPSAAQQAQLILHPSTRVVAAFQNVPAKQLPKQLGQPIDADVLVCSDDQEAAEVVIELARKAGMNSYYAGLLINAIIVEGLTSILISLNKYYDVRDASIKITGISNK